MKLGDVSKAAACTSPVPALAFQLPVSHPLPCRCFAGEKRAGLWKYKALTLQSIKENRQGKKKKKELNNYLGLIKDLPGEIAVSNYKGKIKSSSEMKMTSWRGLGRCRKRGARSTLWQTVGGRFGAKILVRKDFSFEYSFS